jgi:hypothetical protein
VNFGLARKNLESALDAAPTFMPKRLGEREQEIISQIVLGRHLTFRYILITALLAKVTDSSVHMRSLQAGSDLYGAYDARSLCHKVWVPFEQSRMNSKLGGSNEPYLNKPARFPSVDPSNAVRKGYDQNLLNLMYSLLEKLNGEGQETQREAFFYAMKLIDGRSMGLAHEISLPPIYLTQGKTISFFKSYLSACHGGESAASAAGALFRVLYSGQNRKVTVHPANQAGSTSNEIGDIDITQKKSLLMAVEVKDKLFAASDVNHAIRKVIESGNSRLFFLIGRHAFPVPQEFSFAKICNENAKRGMDVSFESLDELFPRLLALFSEEERKQAIRNAADILDEMRATDPTKNHFKNCLSQLDRKG